MTINVPPDVATYVKSQVENGTFQTPDEVLRAAMHSLQRDTQRQRAVDELRSSLRIAAEQIGRGEQDDCDQAFDEIEVELFGKKMADP